MICKICKKQIKGADKIKRKGVWQHKHKIVYSKQKKRNFAAIHAAMKKFYLKPMVEMFGSS